MARNDNLRMAMEKATVNHDGELEAFKQKFERLVAEAEKKGLSASFSVKRSKAASASKK